MHSTLAEKPFSPPTATVGDLRVLPGMGDWPVSRLEEAGGAEQGRTIVLLFRRIKETTGECKLDFYLCAVCPGFQASYYWTFSSGRRRKNKKDESSQAP